MNEEHSVFTAVQEDATSFCMDWPVFEADESHEIHFKGTVFVLDVAGSRMGDMPLAAPGDAAADEVLHRMGWARCGGWHRDDFGRQAARVVVVNATSPVRSTGRPPAASPIGSLAEEAALHLA